MQIDFNSDVERASPRYSAIVNVLFNHLLTFNYSTIIARNCSCCQNYKVSQYGRDITFHNHTVHFEMERVIIKSGSVYSPPPPGGLD